MMDDFENRMKGGVAQEEAQARAALLARAEILGVPWRLGGEGPGRLASCFFLTTRPGDRALALRPPGGALDLAALAAALGWPRLSLGAEITVRVELGVPRAALTPLALLAPEMADARLLIAPALRRAQWLGFQIGGGPLWLRRADLTRVLKAHLADGAGLSRAIWRGPRSRAASPGSDAASPPAP